MVLNLISVGLILSNTMPPIGGVMLDILKFNSGFLLDLGKNGEVRNGIVASKKRGLNDTEI